MVKEQKLANVWDAIETSPSQAASMKARSDLMMAVRKIVDGWKGTQAEAAKWLGITQPRVNDLLRGRIAKFSLDALTTLRPALACRFTSKSALPRDIAGFSKKYFRRQNTPPHAASNIL